MAMCGTSRGWAHQQHIASRVVVCPALAPLKLAMLQAAPVYEVAEGLETPVQLLYLAGLAALLSGAAYLVGKQVINRQQMDERTKQLGEVIREGRARSEDYYELGVVLARKRLFTQALKNYTKAAKLWDGDESELAQVHNAMGFCYLGTEKLSIAEKEFRLATKLQPGYVIAWNNLADVLEKQNKLQQAANAYQAAYDLDPKNEAASWGVERLRTKMDRMSSVM